MITPELTLPVEQPRNPLDFKDSELFSSDFDNTQALTFEGGPGIITVEQAYDDAILKIFGPNAVAFYRKQGGHLNRTPAEIAESVIPYTDEPGIFSKITVLMEIGYPTADILADIDRNTHRTNSRVTYPLNPHADEPQTIRLEAEELQAVVQLLIDSKLEPLVSQIGTRLSKDEFWPRPVPGFLDFYRLLQQAASLDSAVISAGHTDFIRKAYELWEVPDPDIFVTSETISLLGLEKHYTASELAKPSPIVMDMATQQWRRMYGLPADHVTINQVVYVGDSKEKDGGLAANSGATFFHINPEDPVTAWRAVTRYLDIGPLEPAQSRGE